MGFVLNQLLIGATPGLFGAVGETASGTPYDAPTYFSPYYFGQDTPGQEEPVEGWTPYDAPTYFATSYFYSGATSPPVVTTGQTPYNPPTYFPPTYFYGSPPAATVPVGGRSPYNPPTYFSSSYFYGNDCPDLPPVNVAGQPLPGRDGAAYAALIADLTQSQEFVSVTFGDPARRTAAGADASPRVIVIPQGWEEADDADPTLLIRQVSFVVRIVVRSEVDESPFAELDRLTRAVQTRVDRTDLGGQCLPALTRIKGGRYQASNQYPEWSVDLSGEFTMLIDPTATMTLMPY